MADTKCSSPATPAPSHRPEILPCRHGNAAATLSRSWQPSSVHASAAPRSPASARGQLLIHPCHELHCTSLTSTSWLMALSQDQFSPVDQWAVPREQDASRASLLEGQCDQGQTAVGFIAAGLDRTRHAWRQLFLAVPLTRI